MNEGAVYLAKAVQHQVSSMTFDAPEWSAGALEATGLAYHSTWNSLIGGTLLSLPPELGFGSEASGRAIFTNTDQYAVFLVHLGRSLNEAGFIDLAMRAFALNKSLHGLNIWTAVEMPEVFRLVHCVGTVIGRATLGNYLVVGHGCTIGASDKREYPILGSRVSLRAHSSVLGRSIVGDNVAVSSGVTLINVEVPSNTLVIHERGQVVYIESEYPSRYAAKAFGLTD